MSLLGFKKGDIIELDNIDIIHEHGVDKLTMYITESLFEDRAMYYCEYEDEEILIVVEEDETIEFYYLEYSGDINDGNPFIDGREFVDNIDQTIEFDDGVQTVVKWKSVSYTSEEYAVMKYESDNDEYNYKRAISVLSGNNIDFFVGNEIKKFEINIFKNEKL